MALASSTLARGGARGGTSSHECRLIVIDERLDFGEPCVLRHVHAHVMCMHMHMLKYVCILSLLMHDALVYGAYVLIDP